MALTTKLPTALPGKLASKLPTVTLLSIDLDEAKKPALAAVGVLDAALEQVKGQVKELPAEARKVQETVQSRLDLSRLDVARVKSLRTELEGRLSAAQSSATALYGEIAGRGGKLVGQVRRQQSTQTAVAEGKAAVKKAQASAASVSKAGKAARTSAKTAASTVG